MSLEVLESECLEIESATSNKAVNQKPQQIVELSQTLQQFIESNQLVDVGWKDVNLLEKSLLSSAFTHRRVMSHNRGSNSALFKAANPLQISGLQENQI